jgi:hypothetical protein
VLPRGGTVRRTAVRCRQVPLAEALTPLIELPAGADATDSATAWSAAVTTAVDLVARGRLRPGLGSGGTAAWHAGPLDAADADRLDGIAAAMPAAAHALELPGPGPRRVATPRLLLDELCDAVADRLVRSSAAPRVGAPPLTAPDPGPAAPALARWLAAVGTDTSGTARTGLRLVLDDGTDDDRSGAFRAVVQLRSQIDPSLVVDAADLWSSPATVLARLGPDADTDLLVSLRRLARAWPPALRLLEGSRPESLDLEDDEVGELLGDAAEAIAAAQVEVLWPKELLAATPTLRAVVSSSAPAGVAGSTMALDQLLTFRWEATVGDLVLDADVVEALAEAKRPLVRLRGRWVVADPTLAEKLRRSVRTLGTAEALTAALAGRLDAPDGTPVEVRAEGGIAAVVERIAAADGTTRSLPEPPGLDATLRPYQRRGLAWLAEMAELGLGGCLADDMGLGKTLQVIALHLHRQATGHRQPMLVICPASLLGNWQRELQRFAPGIPCRRYHGGDRTLDDLAGDEVVLATYGVVRRDHSHLAAVPWGLAVADEAQHAKNPNSASARAIRAVPAAARIALTGTPIENRLTDLWAVLDWTTPGLLGSLEGFRRRVAIPVERHRDPEAAAAFARSVRPFLLRRRKIDPGIAPELPAKTESDVVVPLTAEQATLYEALVRESLARIADAEGIGRRGLVLKLLTELKQVCNHPAQLLGQPGPLPGRSGKLTALEELLDVVVGAGDSVLVFSQYVAMARLLERHLATLGIPTLFLHGGVSAATRDTMVERFQAGEVPVFLLSLKAGGTGLNLTRATHVVHYDRWWNPAVEDQASDRAWRIGQDRPVQVHRLVTEGTVEDRVATLLASKRSLAESVMGGGEAWIGELGDDELRDLVTLGSER